MPGHGGLMDEIETILSTVAVILAAGAILLLLILW